MADHDETILAGFGIDDDAAFGGVTPPINMAASYSLVGFAQKRVFDYSRTANPTRALLADALAKLERGAGAVVTSSGMAAVDLVLSLLPGGARVVAPHDCYGGTWRLLDARARKGAIKVEFIDQSDSAAVDAALAGETALLWIETPSNPLMRIVDIERLAACGKAVGAKVAVDNTFLSPLLQKPIPLGADFAVHSTTKFINGHSDVVGGAVVAAEASAVEELAWWANCCGVTGAAFDAWLTLRGLRTLSVRIERQQQSALHLAEWLIQCEAVETVHYPGLATHAGYDIARRQQAGFGAMLSFEVKPAVDPKIFLQRLSLFTLAQSLGGVESLIAHPATMTHAAMTTEAKKAAGISERLFRLSVGLEHTNDQIADIRGALGYAR